MFSTGWYTGTMPKKPWNERVEAMSPEVEFSTLRYEWVHGRKPRGYGLWYFLMPDGFTFSQEGTFPRAKLAAAAHARRRFVRGVVRIQVCN